MSTSGEGEKSDRGEVNERKLMNENMYGFLLIDNDDKKAKLKELKLGDEFKHPGTNVWYPVTREGEFAISTTYRRPLILPDSEWQLIPWETFQSAKAAGIWPRSEWQFTDDGESWFERRTGQLEGNILAIRRRKQKPVSGWVSVKERLPEKGKVVLCKGHFASNNAFADFDYLICALLGYEDGRIDVFITSTQKHFYFTPHYWMEVPTAPTPPTPELSASEKVFYNWLDSVQIKVSVEDARFIWNAAYNTGATHTREGKI